MWADFTATASLPHLWVGPPGSTHPLAHPNLELRFFELGFWQRSAQMGPGRSERFPFRNLNGDKSWHQSERDICERDWEEAAL